MKTNEMICLGVVIVLTILAAVGCQPNQSRADEPVVEPVTAEPVEVVDSGAAVESQPEPAESAAVVPEKTAPKIVMTKSVHDFGKIGPASSHKADYEFKNEGSAALKVTRIQSTCGCSKPTLIKDGKRFAMPLKTAVLFEPGESGQIEVTFKSPTRKGKVEKSLYVLSNDPASGRTKFSVKAEIMVKVSVEPETVDLKLDVENAGMPDIVVKSTDGREFSIKSATDIQKAITIPFDPKVKATEFTLKPEVLIEKLGQSKTGVIRIKTTHPQSGTLMVRYNVKQMYELTNPRFILRDIDPGKPIIRENLIRSNYGKPVQIESVESRNGYMSLESQQPEGDHMRLSVKITPPDRGESNRRYVSDELTLTLKDGQKLAIRCTGWFRSK